MVAERADISGILISVKPRFARALMSGEKRAEVRRQFPIDDSTSSAFIYSSSPDQVVLGSVKPRDIVEIAPAEVWDAYGDQLMISRTELGDYLEGAGRAIVIEVHDPFEFAHPVCLVVLRDVLGIRPSQNYRYLTRLQAATLVELGQNGQ